MKQNMHQIRQDEAKNKAKFVQSTMKLDHYKIEGDNILMLTGPYSGLRLTELWNRGTTERDYLFRNLYKRGDPEVIRIMKVLFCQA